MTQPKNYIGFVNDHSGSMASLASAAKNDYNATIVAVKDAASREMLDTVVSVVAIGYPNGRKVTRQVVISNPHVLKPVDSWPITGGTPLYDGIGDMINLFASLPDAREPHVSFLVMATTDGEEMDSVNWSRIQLANRIKELQNTGRWTFVLRVPKGARHTVGNLNVPLDNIQEWETSDTGMQKSTVATTQAMDGYFAARSAGKQSSTVFYANAAAVDTSKLLDISDKTSLYVVAGWENGDQIRDFILRRRTRYLKGSAFYQLTKTEARVGPNKIIAVRPRSGADAGKIFAGKEARTMLGLSSVDNIRLHPGDHGNFDIFIQSESVNRKLVGGTGVLYWEEIGVPFTQDEIDRFNGAPKPAAPAVVVLPAVAPTNKPTPSPLKPVAKVVPASQSGLVATKASHHVAPQPVPGQAGRVRYHVPDETTDAFFWSRDEARNFAEKATHAKFAQYDAGPTAPKGKRWFVSFA